MRSSHLGRMFGVLAFITSTSALSDPKSSGSGFAIGDGSLVVTSNHVVEGCSGINVPGVGPAALIRADARADLAILKPNRPLARGLRFRAGHPVKLGEEVVVMGFPLRGLLSSPPTVTTGIVSSLAGLRDDRTEMQISAPVQPGNSGGPVLDRSGNVIGVVESKLDAIRAAKITGDIPQNVNFAVHSSIVTSVLDSYAINYDVGSFEIEKPISEIVAASLPAVVVLECLGTEAAEKAPGVEARGTSVTPCGGNSDEQITQPVLNLYDSIRRRDIDQYADQWSEKGVYVRADKGTVKNLDEKIAERRSAFKRWKSVYLNANDISVYRKDMLSATIGVRYLMVTHSFNGEISNDAEVLESYDVVCTPPTGLGKWLIIKNIDYLQKFGQPR
jgi:hypothetical protein